MNIAIRRRAVVPLCLLCLAGCSSADPEEIAQMKEAIESLNERIREQGHHIDALEKNSEIFSDHIDATERLDDVVDQLLGSQTRLKSRVGAVEAIIVSNTVTSEVPDRDPDFEELEQRRLRAQHLAEFMQRREAGTYYSAFSGLGSDSPDSRHRAATRIRDALRPYVLPEDYASLVNAGDALTADQVRAITQRIMAGPTEDDYRRIGREIPPSWKRQREEEENKTVNINTHRILEERRKRAEKIEKFLATHDGVVALRLVKKLHRDLDQDARNELVGKISVALRLHLSEEDQKKFDAAGNEVTPAMVNEFIANARRAPTAEEYEAIDMRVPRGVKRAASTQ